MIPSEPKPIQIIRIGFSYTPSFVSKVIRLLTGSDISHALLLVQDPLLGEMVISEEFSGLKVVSRTEFESDGSKIPYILDPVVNLESSLKSLSIDIGDSYDYLGLLGMSWVLVCKWFGRRVRNPCASHINMICSRFVATVMVRAGWPGSDQIDLTTIDPADLLAFVRTGTLP